MQSSELQRGPSRRRHACRAARPCGPLVLAEARVASHAAGKRAPRQRGCAVPWRLALHGLCKVFCLASASAATGPSSAGIPTCTGCTRTCSAQRQGPPHAICALVQIARALLRVDVLFGGSEAVPLWTGCPCCIWQVSVLWECLPQRRRDTYLGWLPSDLTSSTASESKPETALYCKCPPLSQALPSIL